MAPDRLSVPLDRLAAAGDSQLRRILLYARGRRDPFTAAEAAVALDVHRNVARDARPRVSVAVPPDRDIARPHHASRHVWELLATASPAPSYRAAAREGRAKSEIERLRRGLRSC